MSPAQIEPRLAEEIRRAEAAGEPGRRIPVIIEHVEPAEVPPGGRLDDLDRRVREQLAGIVEQLSALGAGDDVRQSTMANAVSTRLDPAGLAEIAKREDVRIIRLEREEQVTA